VPAAGETNKPPINANTKAAVSSLPLGEANLNCTDP
jgi:hypothetical protein